MTPVVFKITPMGKPRMVQSDRWKKRDRVQRYWAFKDFLVNEARKQNYEVGEVLEDVLFVIPMPASWTKKKKKALLWQSHRGKPDLDNCIKSLQDCLCDDDSHVHTYNNIRKIWGLEGGIIIGTPHLDPA